MTLAFVCPIQPSFNALSFTNEGVGGSEASFICLTRELAVLGHRVIAYTLTETEGVYDKVVYRNIRNYIDSPAYDALVVFRAAFGPLERSLAARRIFWSTDITVSDWDKAILPHVDHWLAMSPFHSEFVRRHYLLSDSIPNTILGLGVVAGDYFEDLPDNLPQKHGSRLIYCSVPDRGLDCLARLFPQIRERVPTAELLVTSDFRLWGLDAGNAQIRALLENMEGVVFRGKVPRNELVALQKSSRVMAYPCTYHEGFCLSALECIAAGAVPVTTDAFALTTTVGEHGVLISGRPGEPRYDTAFVEHVTRLLRDEEVTEEMARQGRRYVNANMTWSHVAKRFESIVNQIPRRGSTRIEVTSPESVTRPTSAAPDACSVAVVIPIYQQFQYLERVLCSVVWQLRDCDELIVVNDASPDWRDTRIPEGFRHRAMWLHNDERSGVSFSRNAGIRRSGADWIKFLDADDVLAPFALDFVRDSRIQISSEVQVLAGGCHRVSDGQYLDFLDDTDQSLLDLKHSLPILPSAAFVRRRALLEVGLFNEKIDLEEDWDLWFRIYERFGLRGFATTRRPVCYYWMHSGERAAKKRLAVIDGIPVREYFRRRYGADPR